MCGRFVILRQLEDIAQLFEVGAIDAEGLGPSYNIAPTNLIPAIIDDGETRRLVARSWGFIPSWADPEKNLPKPINARAETVGTSGMFRNALARRRCLIPADGFYEWSGSKGNRQPHYIHRADDAMMAMAGIWEHWDGHGNPNKATDSATIITTSANQVVGRLHDRMPVVLDPADWDLWLDPEIEEKEAALSLLKPADDELLEYYPVSREVNSVRVNRPDLIEPVEQGKLF